MWFRDLDTKKTKAVVFGELRNVVLEENGDDKMVRTNEVVERVEENRVLLNNILCTKAN